MSTKVCRSMSTKYYRRANQQNFDEVCPLNYIGGPTNIYRSMSNKVYRRLTNEFSKTKIFCFENSFSYMENACVREPMRTQDMGQGM